MLRSMMSTLQSLWPRRATRPRAVLTRARCEKRHGLDTRTPPRHRTQPGGLPPPDGSLLGSVAGRELGAGSKGGDWERWPEDLRFRRFPSAARAAAAS